MDLSITNIMMNITNQFQPYHLSINSFTNTNSNSPISSLLNANTNMTGLLNCLTTSRNGYYLLCGFTTGIITALDLRMGQVIHIWREYQDSVVDVSNFFRFSFMVLIIFLNLSLLRLKILKHYVHLS